MTRRFAGRRDFTSLLHTPALNMLEWLPKRDPMNVRCIVLPLFLTAGILTPASTLFGNEAVDRAHRYEDAGDSAAAREVYSRALQSSPRDPEIRHRLRRDAGAISRYRRA